MDSRRPRGRRIHVQQLDLPRPRSVLRLARCPTRRLPLDKRRGRASVPTVSDWPTAPALSWQLLPPRDAAADHSLVCPPMAGGPRATVDLFTSLRVRRFRTVLANGAELGRESLALAQPRRDVEANGQTGGRSRRANDGRTRGRAISHGPAGVRPLCSSCGTKSPN